MVTRGVLGFYAYAHLIRAASAVEGRADGYRAFG
jgi:hypothetical protein